MNRLTALLLTIPLAMPLSAAAPRKWAFGVHGATPSLGGHFVLKGDALLGGTDVKIDDTNFDIEKDFGLKADGMGMGLHASYLGPRFGLSLDYLAADYAGDAKITRDIDFGGYRFVGNGLVTSSIKTTVIDLNWTIKVLKIKGAWLGVDLGAQYWDLALDAKGIAYVDNPLGGEPIPDPNGPLSVSEAVRVPVPQVGLSGGVTAFGDRLDARARFAFLAYNGASYTRIGLDGRFYPLPWRRPLVGVRAFFDSQSLDVPDGSIVDDLEAGLDRSAVGFGVVIRF
jgi:hypothetical protein